MVLGTAHGYRVEDCPTTALIRGIRLNKKGENPMGLQMWLARRQVRGIVNALRTHYDQGRGLTGPGLTDPDLYSIF